MLVGYRVNDSPLSPTLQWKERHRPTHELEHSRLSIAHCLLVRDTQVVRPEEICSPSPRLRQKLLVLVILASIAPLLWPTIPPLSDLPAHIGRYHIQLSNEFSPWLAQWYSFHWSMIGNLGVDILVEVLGPSLGLELSVKAIVIGVVIVYTIGAIWISREVHGNTQITALPAIPFVYNYSFVFGFVNYALSMALALVAFAFWLTLGRYRQFRLRWFLFSLIGPLIWVAHAYGWAFLCVLCFSSSLDPKAADPPESDATAVRWFKIFTRAALDCLPLALPFLLMLLWRSDVASASSGWPDIGLKLRWTLFMLRDRWMWLDIPSALMVIGVSACALCGIGGLSVHHRLRPAIILLALCILLLSTIVFSSYFAAERLIPYFFVIVLLAIKTGSGTRRRQAAITSIALFFVATRLTANTISFWLYDRSWTSELQALNAIPRGSRVLALVATRCRPEWQNQRFEHLPSFAIARRDAFTNDQWAAAGAQLLRIHYAPARPLVADPSQLAFDGDCAGPDRQRQNVLRSAALQAFDRLWLIDWPPATWPREKRIRLIWRNDRSAVFQITPNTASGDQ